MIASIALGSVLLSTLVPTRPPWRSWEAGSEQRPPSYLGRSPLELERDAKPAGAVLPASLRASGEAQFLKLAAALPPGPVELEAWPSPDDYGNPAWQAARWRPAGGGPWRWVDGLPLYRPWVEAERRAVFDDFLTLPELVDKPVFGDCVWTDEDGGKSAGGWLPPSEREPFAKSVARAQAKGQRVVCRLLGQPARVDGKPKTFVIGVNGSRVSWPDDIKWSNDLDIVASSASPKSATAELSLQADFVEALRSDVLALDGEQEARFPLGRQERFTRKNASDPAHQLEAVADFLIERYRALGIPVGREPFIWRGIKQSNVVARIKGSAPKTDNAPVVLVDHYDAAYAEDVFESTSKRVSAPGADDDASGTAALLRAAAVLAKSKPRQDIWLVHLTGEEYPGDDLGARKFLSRLLGRGRRFSGFIVLDMIGHHTEGDGLFQLNPGRSPGSAALAATALALSSSTVEPWMRPVVRPPDDERSYLYNTDGQLISDAGYPVLLINEHLNRLENYGRPGHHRPGYHRSDDTAAGVDFQYAAALAKLAIAAAWQAANPK